MKLTTNRKILESELKRFVTKGRLTQNSKEGTLIKIALILAEENFLVFVGSDESGAILGRLRVAATVEETGDVVLGDIGSLLTTIGTLKGEDVEITIDDSEFMVSDGTKELSFGVEVVPFRKGVRQWNEWHIYFAEQRVVFSDGKSETSFIHWFDCEKSEDLKAVAETVQKFVRSDTVVFITTGESLTVYCADTETKRHYQDEFDEGVTIIDPAEFTIGYVFPVLKNLSGPVEFYYILNAKGLLRLWIHNGNIEWMVRYNDPQPE